MRMLVNFIRARRLEIILAAVGGVLLIPTLFGGFVDDDLNQIVRNASVHNLAHLTQFFLPGQAHYRPLMFVAFSLLYKVGSGGPLVFHLLEALLFLVNALLVFWLLQQFLPRLVAFWGALLFLIHPANAEAAAYIADVQDVLFVFFGLAAIVMVSKFEMRRWGRGSAIAGLVLLALLAKETAFVFILLVPLFAWFKNRQRLLESTAGAMTGGLIYIGMRLGLAHGLIQPEMTVPINRLSLGGRLLNLPLILWHYVVLAIAPIKLSIGQVSVITQPSLQNFTLPLFGDIFIAGLITYLGWYLWKRQKNFQAYIFFAFWFAFGLGPHLQLLPLDATTADRWLYLAMVGLVGMLGVALSAFIPKTTDSKLVYIALSFVAVVLAGRSIVRGLNFRDNQTMLVHDISVNPDSYILQDEYGLSLVDEGKYQEGRIHLYKSVSLYAPGNAAWNNLGISYLREGDNDLAVEYFKKSVVNAPEFRAAYYNLGSLYLGNQDPANAVGFLTSATQRFDNDGLLWAMQAAALGRAGQMESARLAYQRATNLAAKRGDPPAEVLLQYKNQAGLH